MTRILALTAVLLLATGVSACGKVGQLERPGPMFGKATEIPTNDAGAPPQDPGRPLETVDPRDRSTDPSPVRTAPIGGTNPGATGLPPRTALPDPYANPRR